MANPVFDILLYVTKDGKTPFTDWLSELKDKKGRYLIKARLDRIEDGNFGDCKPARDGVFELRIDHGPGYRVYFAREERRVVILLCGGAKSSQDRDINRAVKYWRDYEARKTGKTGKELS